MSPLESRVLADSNRLGAASQLEATNGGVGRHLTWALTGGEQHQRHRRPVPDSALERPGLRREAARFLLCAGAGDSHAALDNLRRESLWREVADGRAGQHSGAGLHHPDLVHTGLRCSRCRDAAACSAGRASHCCTLRLSARCCSGVVAARLVSPICSQLQRRPVDVQKPEVPTFGRY